MLREPKHDDRIDGLAEQLQIARTIAPDLIYKTVADPFTWLPLLKAGKASRIGQLIEAGAWSDAALTLLELELPAWKLRRLVYENGEWFCSFTRQPNLPVAIDDTVDAKHEVLPLAVLSAFVAAAGMRNGFEARRLQYGRDRTV